MPADPARTNPVVLETAREILLEGIAQIDEMLAGKSELMASAMLTPIGRSALARANGFNGDICPNCCGASMRRTGPCLTCQDCGSNTGCS